MAREDGWWVPDDIRAVLPPRSRAKQPCRHPDGCTGEGRHGYCAKHLAHLATVGDFNLPAVKPRQPGQKRCHHPDGCDLPHKGYGLCARHKLRLDGTGLLGPLDDLHHDNSGTCRHPDGCPAKAANLGYCKVHYDRHKRRNGDLGPVGMLKLHSYAGEPCAHPEGCEEPARRNGYCGMHDARLRRLGSLGPKHKVAGVVQADEPCLYGPSCPLPVTSSGWCPIHRQDQLLLQAALSDGLPRCKHPDGCSDPAHLAGWCQPHYNRLASTGTAGEVGRRKARRGEGCLARGYVVHWTIATGTIPEHRLVMALHIGRMLLGGETVHHRNGVRHDNRIDNLELWATNHRPGQRIDDLLDWVVRDYTDRITHLQGASPTPAGRFDGLTVGSLIEVEKRRITTEGYVDARVGGRWAREHRHVMEAMLGRSLRKGENVHHRNGVRDDNAPSNLELWHKPQTPGQRVDDIVRWVIDTYPNELAQRLSSRSVQVA